MPRKKGSTTKGTSRKTKKRKIEQYEHGGKERVNNPPVGLVTPESDPLSQKKKKYEYDPHLDPQLVWAGKAEHTSFEIPTVSLHVHERIDPKSIIDAVRKRNGNGNGQQPSLFDQPEENPPLRDALDFYKHKHGWTNRLIAGDSLLVMNSLLEKEGMAGQVQMVYIDPPYGIRYGSNFQPFVNKRDVRDGKDDDLTHEPETVKAFRDTWELGIHSYLGYLRDRLKLSRDLLSESGSCIVQISDENLHLVRNLMDEVFGTKNFFSLITVRKTGGLGASGLKAISDFLVWYGKDIEKIKYRQLFIPKADTDVDESFQPVSKLNELQKKGRVSGLIIPDGAKSYITVSLTSSGATPSCIYGYEFAGTTYWPVQGYSWKPNKEGMEKLHRAGRLIASGSTLRWVYYKEDFPVSALTNNWTDTGGASDKVYVVQTSAKVADRCLLMCTDPGDLVFDPTCGSGTSAFVAEHWGRRWISCDTSRVAIALAKQRLMTSAYNYYELAHDKEGISSGFLYKTVPHVTLRSLANDEPPSQESIFDQPRTNKNKARVTGPFTVEAVPAQTVKSIDEIETKEREIPPTAGHADTSISRSGATLRHTEWRDELLRTGIRGKGGQTIEFSRVEPLGGTRHLHADAETKDDKPQRAVICFGPEHGPLEQRDVNLAWSEAQTLIPKPSIVLFAAFQFDPEAAKDIDELKPESTGMTFLKAQMNADMLTDDLKKKRASNESFWLVGQPDVELRQISKGEHKGKWQVEVNGFDYYNTKSGTVESGDNSRIAMWMLDTDYDERSLFPQQVFFPMAGEKEGWAKLAKNLKAEIDLELIEAYRGTVSLPFELGEYKQVAVKIIDDRGIESLKILRVN